MGEFADCYVLVPERSKQLIDDFLDVFLPERKEYADEYEVPQYSDEPGYTFSSVDELIGHLVTSVSEPYSIYWASTGEGDVRFAMCFFTNDGWLILGLSTEAKVNDTSREDYALNLLKRFASNGIGYITYEEPPPLNSKQFMERAKQAG
jgi:hypothetical protein